MNGPTYANELSIELLVNKEFIEVLIHILKFYEDEEILLTAVEALENIFFIGYEIYQNTECNPYIIRFENASGIKILEELQKHKSSKICDKISKFIESFPKYDQI